jgi:hypothetical protein
MNVKILPAADAATHGLAGNHANRLGYSHLVDPTRSPAGASS